MLIRLLALTAYFIPTHGKTKTMLEILAKRNLQVFIQSKDHQQLCQWTSTHVCQRTSHLSTNINTRVTKHQYMYERTSTHVSTNIICCVNKHQHSRHKTLIHVWKNINYRYVCQYTLLKTGKLIFSTSLLNWTRLENLDSCTIQIIDYQLQIMKFKNYKIEC